jgi:hypothetical protein
MFAAKGVVELSQNREKLESKHHGEAALFKDVVRPSLT